MTSFLVILINIVFSYKGFKDRLFFDKYKFNPNGIKKGENIRYLSSGFLHVNEGHLFVNMFTLFFFAPVVIRLLGDISFILIYLVSLYVGNLITYRLNNHRINYNAVGASGAVMGVAEQARDLGRFPLLFRGGFGAPRRNIIILEIAKL